MTLTNVEKLEFVHKISKNIKHGSKTFFDHLFNTSSIVEKLCNDIGIIESRYLIDAALYHSIYGTDYFEHNTAISREQIALIIGEKAEQLVHFFCSLPDRNIQILQHKFTPDQLQRDLYILEYANLLEISVDDVQSTGALNPAKIFRLKLLRANLIDHYKFTMPPLPFNFPSK